MLISKHLVIPSLRAKATEIDEATERNYLDKSPDRHIVLVFLNDVSAIGIICAKQEFPIKRFEPVFTQRLPVFNYNAVSILIQVIGNHFQ